MNKNSELTFNLTGPCTVHDVILVKIFVLSGSLCCFFFFQSAAWIYEMQLQCDRQQKPVFQIFFYQKTSFIPTDGLPHNVIALSSNCE
jgi:hypothetical protein